jgi:hypothetical protein
MKTKTGLKAGQAAPTGNTATITIRLAQNSGQDGRATA